MKKNELSKSGMSFEHAQKILSENDEARKVVREHALAGLEKIEKQREAEFEKLISEERFSEARLLVEGHSRRDEFNKRLEVAERAKIASSVKHGRVALVNEHGELLEIDHGLSCKYNGKNILAARDKDGKIVIGYNVVPHDNDQSVLQKILPFAVGY